MRGSEDEEIEGGEMRLSRNLSRNLLAAAVVLLAAVAATARGSFSCPAEDVTFELATGHVFQSPADILGRVSPAIFQGYFRSRTVGGCATGLKK